ncbi:hypothetical protein Tco_1067253 [Tanacetum coccineum]|uniref:Uncharacterized protein n=1 Tax=Tanacetum coccineum TaxID=301880 RepID=A0ABQ5HCB9_9ASTR
MISASTCYFDVTVSTFVFEEQIAYTQDLIDFGVAIHTITFLKDKVCALRLECFLRVSVWEGAEEKDTAQQVQNIINIKAEKCKKVKLLQDMQLIQRLRDDQKCMKKVFKDMSGSYEQKSNQDRDHR